jgi:hypothetical protein
VLRLIVAKEKTSLKPSRARTNRLLPKPNRALNSIMAQIWTETYNPKRHSDKMSDFTRLPGVPRGQYWKAPTLQQYPVYFVRVCNFTFEFHSLEQLKACLAFFSRKVRPSSMIKLSEADRRMTWLHWKCQRWFERLPMQLLEERRRVRIAPALKEALEKFQKNPNKNRRNHAANNSLTTM